MAKASKTAKPQVIQYNYTLELTEEEASLIMALVGNVVGTGPERQLCTPIYDCLRQVGIRTVSDPWGAEQTLAMQMSAKLKGDIRFEDN